MRIVGGHFRSRKLAAPRDLDLRPTSDRLRETLFNILANGVAGSTFVDAYAGTGAVGIEALSRGARHAIFIERHAASVELIAKNLRALKIPFEDCEKDPADSGGGTGSEIIGQASIVTMDAVRALKKLAAAGVRADYIFGDPPYAEDHRLHSLLKFVSESQLLAPGGLAIAEHSSRKALPENFGTLRRIRVATQGDSALSFFAF